MRDLVCELQSVADGYQRAADEEAAIDGEGTEDQSNMESMAELLFSAAAEIARLRQPDLFRKPAKPERRMHKRASKAPLLTSRIYAAKSRAQALSRASGTAKPPSGGKK